MSTLSQTALITGASSGLGLEMARLLAARGFDLVLVSRSLKEFKKLARQLTKDNGVDVHTIAMDLGQRGSAQQLFEQTQEAGIEIDVLINNAGVGMYGEHLDLDIDGLNNLLQLNVMSLCDLCHVYGQEMKERRDGRILNVASTAAYQPTPFLAAYGASKAFVLSFSEALAMELEDYEVTVSCLSPGPTDTSFFDNLDTGKTPGETPVGSFDLAHRDGAREVAEAGIDMMFKGELSRIFGTRNYLQALSGRFAPRRLVASVTKIIMKPVTSR